MAVKITIVAGDEITGLYAADGSYNVVNVTAETDPQGVYHSCGAYNVSLVDGEGLVGVFAPNGSFNVIESSSPKIYHPCGAWNVEVISGTWL